LKKRFKLSLDVLVTSKPLLWASFVPTLYPENDTTKRPLTDIYCEIVDRSALRRVCEESIADYNSFYTSSCMNLVLFEAAIQHVAKIIRVITTTFGHCLLVGVGGSGRKTLAALSTFIAYQNQIFQIDQLT